MAFFITFGIAFLNNKDKKSKKKVLSHESQPTLVVYFFKGIISNIIKIVIKGINS